MMRSLPFLVLALTLPAMACQGKEALACFWALLPVAILYGPDFGLRLIGQFPSAMSPSVLVAWVVGLSWAGFFSTTWICASILELGMEAGGAGLLAGHFAGGLPPWLASRWFPRPVLPIAMES